MFTRILQTTMLTLLTGGLILLAACNNGPSARQASEGIDDTGLPIVTLAADKEGADFNPADFKTTVERSDGGFTCTVYAADNYNGGDAVFLSANYNAKSFHSYAIKIGPGLDNDTLGLAAEKEPGQVVAGLVNIPQATTPALQSGMAVCSFHLIPGASPKAASEVATKNMTRAKNLDLYQNDEQKWVLAWDYTNPGDSDQDGEVSISDLQPIAENYLERVSNNWDDPLRNVDGDENGEISSADIVPMAMNFDSQIWAYQIEMSDTSDGTYIVVGQLVLAEQNVQLNKAVRFEYTFGAQYVPHAWYRVVPILPNGNQIEVGSPSESICEDGRRMDPITVQGGATVTVVICAQKLPSPITSMNSVRVVFPDTFSYVPNSANPGSLGGTKFDPDGIWATFATSLLFPPDSFLVERDCGPGYEGYVGIDFNVTSLNRFLDKSPVLYGQLINFKLKNEGNKPLTLEFQRISPDGLDRTYYTDITNAKHYFGNSISFKVK
jgi:hypothetical protein